jgi:hypothetical protein
VDEGALGTTSGVEDLMSSDSSTVIGRYIRILPDVEYGVGLR